MLIIIVYSKGFTLNAYSLSEAVKDEWSDVNVNLMGVYGKHDGFARYQIQIGNRTVVYNSESVTDNDTIINLIKEKL